MTVRTVAILGSTGSIGTQAVELAARHRDEITVTALAAGGTQPELIAQQVAELGVGVVALADPAAAGALRAALGARSPHNLPDILTGPDAARQVAASGPDIVLNAITGAVGLRPTLAALEAGSTLALANKESMVMAAGLVRAAQRRPDQIVPVDSEHSAIAQSLRAGAPSEVTRLIVTASGGPFRGQSRAQLAAVTPAQALRHPNFSMGTVITTNSATLVNKGLEVIEAHALFDIPLDRIDVVVHPEQIIHSMVEFRDGATIAEAGPPRMTVPIALGLSWPQRWAEVDSPIDWTQASTWHFEPLDEVAFPAVRIAREASRAGGGVPAAFNAANEVCVAAFHAGSIGFLAIVDTVAAVVNRASAEGWPGDTLDAVLTADSRARDLARTMIRTT